jgi:hypothetical protein
MSEPRKVVGNLSALGGTPLSLLNKRAKPKNYGSPII